MNNLQTCYMCHSKATSREHVPPLSLFPEKKDIYGLDFRNNLITVPSCDGHNLKRAKDDEYLMACLAGILGNNIIGIIQTRTKVKRALTRKERFSIHSLMKDPKELLIKTDEGEFIPILQGSPDFDRLINCFKHISCGLYYTEFKKIFEGECVIFLGFIKYNDINSEKIKLLCKKTFSFQEKNWRVKGTNPSVFKYQFGPTDNFGLIPLRMIFYEGAEVFASFKPENVKEPFVLTYELIQAGKKVTIELENNEIIEFN